MRLRHHFAPSGANGFYPARACEEEPVEIRNPPDVGAAKDFERILHREMGWLRQKNAPEWAQATSLPSTPPFLETPVRGRRRSRRGGRDATRLSPVHSQRSRTPPATTSLSPPKPSGRRPIGAGSHIPSHRHAGGSTAWPLSKAHREIGRWSQQTALLDTGGTRPALAKCHLLRMGTSIRAEDNR